MNIKELAEQANGEHSHPGGVDWYWDELERFAKLVAAHEREECAKLCEDMKPFGSETALQKATIEDCVAAIRARSQV